jgi:hypothetical protein
MGRDLGRSGRKAPAQTELRPTASAEFSASLCLTQKSDEEATPPWDAARVNLTSKELAPGVFAVMPDDVLDQ